jgi:hypothetical protein
MRPDRRDDETLIVQEAGEETLVYDRQRDRAHALGPLASAIWRACDGRTGPSEIARQVSTEARVDAGLVELALRRLGRARLLKEPVAASTKQPLASRRELLKRAALVGGLGVLSVTVPTAAMAASCLKAGSCGVNSACRTASGRMCCSGRCRQNAQACGTGQFGRQCT